MEATGLPLSPSGFNRQVFWGNSISIGQHWVAWKKPPNVTAISLMICGSGGCGGLGNIGIITTGGGGGGGGSSAQTQGTIPSFFWPDIVYLSIGLPSTNLAGIGSIIATRPINLAKGVIAIAGGGGLGGNSGGAAGGAAGAGGTAGTAATMPLGWPFCTSIAGQSGVAGGGTVTAGANLALPLTGLRVTGGTGGGGLPGSGAVGTNGGGFIVTGTAYDFPAWPGGVGGSAIGSPPSDGATGLTLRGPLSFYNYGGTGGGATHGSAAGAGLVQSRGGDGGPGCGGGGQGGALTGATPAVRSQGGTGFCILTWW